MSTERNSHVLLYEGNISLGMFSSKLNSDSSWEAGIAITVLISGGSPNTIVGGRIDNQVHRTEESAPSSPHISGYTPNQLALSTSRNHCWHNPCSARHPRGHGLH